MTGGLAAATPCHRHLIKILINTLLHCISTPFEYSISYSRSSNSLLRVSPINKLSGWFISTYHHYHQCKYQYIFSQVDRCVMKERQCLCKFRQSRQTHPRLTLTQSTQWEMMMIWGAAAVSLCHDHTLSLLTQHCIITHHLLSTSRNLGHTLYKAV